MGVKDAEAPLPRGPRLQKIFRILCKNTKIASSAKLSSVKIEVAISAAHNNHYYFKVLEKKYCDLYVVVTKPPYFVKCICTHSVCMCMFMCVYLFSTITIVMVVIHKWS